MIQYVTSPWLLPNDSISKHQSYYLDINQIDINQTISWMVSRLS